MKLILSILLISSFAAARADRVVPVAAEARSSVLIDVTENELFDFETDSRDDADFFIEDRSKENISRLASLKNWFVDSYQYCFLYSFIFYLDIKEKHQHYWKAVKNIIARWYTACKKFITITS